MLTTWTRLVSFGVAALALVLAAGGAAALPAANGPIYFVGSRAENFHTEIYSVAADGSARTNLSRNPDADEWPSVSPDGEHIAFLSRRDGQDGLFVMSADGTSQRKLAEGFSAAPYPRTQPVWSPTGHTVILAHAFDPGAWGCQPFDLYAVDVAEGGRRRLAQQTTSDASFSSDGRFLVYQGACGGGSAVLQVDDGFRRTFSVSGHSASFSPRGHRLLFLRGSRPKTRRGSRNAPLVNTIVTVDPFGRRPWALRGVDASAPAWSPDGQEIAFFRGARARLGLYIARPGQRRPRRLAAVPGGSVAAWSPNGEWLAFQAKRGTYVVRATGQGLARVGDAGSPPRWSRSSQHVAFVSRDGAALVAVPGQGSAVAVTSPNVDGVVVEVGWTVGERLVFASRRPAAMGVFAIEPDGSGLRQVAPEGTPTGRISPDGARLAFVRDHHLWTMRLDGGDERQVTSGEARDANPAWSPDGERLAFVRDSEIFVIAADGGSPQQITNLARISERARGWPAWSPDATWIAFTGGALFAVRPDGGGLHEIVSTEGLAAADDPAWSPDGTKLALGGSAIAVVNADGTGYQPLMWPGSAHELQPAWSPDGTKIVFVRSARDDFSADSDLWTINVDGSGEERLTGGPWQDVLPAWTAQP